MHTSANPHAQAGRAGLSLRLAIRYSLWELRGSAGRVLYWVLCLAVGVSAVVSIAALADSLDGAIRREAKSLLAGDLAVSSQVPLREDLALAIAAVPDVRTAELRETVGLVARSSSNPRAHDGARSLLAELRSVGGPYPFHGEVEFDFPDAGGELRTTTSTAVPLERVFSSPVDGSDPTGADEDEVRRGVLAAPELLSALGLEVGDALLVGRARLHVAGVLLAEPDRVPGMFSVGPTVLISASAFEASGLSGFGNFSRRRTLIGLGPTSPAADSVRDELRALIGEDASFRVETYEDAQPLIREGLADLEQFLGLVALLSLLVGGVGIAQGVRTWLASRVDSLAVLKCLGLRPRELFAVYLAQTLVLGLAGSLVGGIIGLLGVGLVPIILSGLVPPEAITLWQPAALLRGLLIGLGVSTAFSLPPLLTVLRVPPARVFRRTAEPLPGSRAADVATFILLLLATTALAAWQAGSLRIGSFFLAGVGTALVLLAAASWALARFASSWATERRRFWLRQGLASLGRPGGGTLGALTAIGLGLLVLLSMALIQSAVLDELAADLPTDAPSAFLINIEKDQWPDLEEMLVSEGADRIQSAPVVMARIAAIDDVPGDQLAEEREARWAFRREMRLTYADELPEDNVVVAHLGNSTEVDRASPWSDPRPEVSIEEEFARGLGVVPGSIITLSVGGQSYDVVVSNVRSVDWQTFSINFFLLVEPGVLEEAPQTRLAAARLPEGREQAIQDQIANSFSNVTVFRIRQLLDKVISLMNQLSFGMRVLGSFTILTGLAILAGAIATSSAERAREVALLKTLGMDRGDVLRIFGTQYALLGAVAALIAVVGSSVLAWAAIHFGFELEWQWRPALLIGALAGGVALTVGVGLLASRRALRTPPVQILREG